MKCSDLGLRSRFPASVGELERGNGNLMMSAPVLADQRVDWQPDDSVARHVCAVGDLENFQIGQIFTRHCWGCVWSEEPRRRRIRQKQGGLHARFGRNRARFSNGRMRTKERCSRELRQNRRIGPENAGESIETKNSGSEVGVHQSPAWFATRPTYRGVPNEVRNLVFYAHYGYASLERASPG